MKRSKWAFLLIICAIAMPGTTLAYDITKNLSVGGIVVGVYQYQDLSDTDAAENADRGTLLFQPEVKFTPTENDEFFASLGFEVGNALNPISPFVLAPYAGITEDDVKDINGSGRDYLLTAWYKHTFKLPHDSTMGLTGGIIDATDYLDDNAYANDEHTQFMNEALVNGPNAFFPSYDWGAAAEFDTGNLSIRGVVMAVSSNEDGNAFDFYGLQVGYTIHTGWGQGTYRLVTDLMSDDFLDPDGTNKEKRKSAFLCFDQQFGDIFGGFLRFGWQDDKAAINYNVLYSGGVNISGKAWGRADDNVGLGYAYLNGGNQDVDRTQVVEAYVRIQLIEFAQLTLDFQYMQDDLRDGGGPKGLICGIRL